MASSLIASLASDFDPSEFEDRYQAALEALIEEKVSTGSTRAAPQVPGAEKEEGGGEVVDLLAALQRSVEKARGARTGTDDAAPAPEAKAPAKSRAASGGSRSRAKKDGETDEPAKPPASRARKPAEKKPAEKEPAPSRAKKPSTRRAS